MTLLPGDIISTGAPAGVGPLLARDEVEVEVEGVGVLRNPVRASSATSGSRGSVATRWRRDEAMKIFLDTESLLDDGEKAKKEAGAKAPR